MSGTGGATGTLAAAGCPDAGRLEAVLFGAIIVADRFFPDGRLAVARVAGALVAVDFPEVAVFAEDRFAGAFFTADFFTAAFFATAFCEAAFFAVAFLAVTVLAFDFFAVAFFTAVFFAVAFFAVAFFAVAFFAVTFLPVAFLPVAFFPVAFFAVAFLGVAFLAVAFLAVVFFATVFFAADFRAAFFAGAIFLLAMVVPFLTGGHCSLATPGRRRDPRRPPVQRELRFAAAASGHAPMPGGCQGGRRAAASEKGASVDYGHPSFGIEEEFFLVHARSRQLVRRVPARLMRECQRRIGSVVCSEMLQSQIEVASPVFHDSAQAYDQLPRLRQQLAAVAETMGYRLAAAGTHPIARWRGQAVTRGARYAQLAEDFQIVGRRNVLCGLHVHCAVPAGEDRVALMNRLLPWLPMFLALSTSSPFWACQPTGLMSYRQAAYDEWPRTGIPDHFDDQPAYDRFVALLTEQGAIPDASYLWWSLRPSLAHPTLELRICDSCTRVDDSLAIAGLFRCLVQTYLAQPALGERRSAMTRRIIDENRWRAKRHGLEADFIVESGSEAMPARAMLAQMLDLGEPQNSEKIVR